MTWTACSVRECHLQHGFFGVAWGGMPSEVSGAEAINAEGASQHASPQGAVGQKGNAQLSTCRHQVLLQQQH